MEHDIRDIHVLPWNILVSDQRGNRLKMGSHPYTSVPFLNILREEKHHRTSMNFTCHLLFVSSTWHLWAHHDVYGPFPFTLKADRHWKCPCGFDFSASWRTLSNHPSLMKSSHTHIHTHTGRENPAWYINTNMQGGWRLITHTSYTWKIFVLKCPYPHSAQTE